MRQIYNFKVKAPNFEDPPSVQFSIWVHFRDCYDLLQPPPEGRDWSMPISRRVSRTKVGTFVYLFWKKWLIFKIDIKNCIFQWDIGKIKDSLHQCATFDQKKSKIENQNIASVATAVLSVATVNDKNAKTWAGGKPSTWVTARGGRRVEFSNVIFFIENK